MVLRIRAIGALILVMLAVVGHAMTAQAQDLACPDGEKWAIDKTALRQLLSSPTYETYAARPDPLVIDLQELGARTGNLVVIYSRQHLACTKKHFETNQNLITGSGAILVCKRPQC